MAFAIMCSGGDAPGMNPAIKKFVDYVYKKGDIPYLIYDGLEGLIDKKIKRATHSDVSGILHNGGTMIRSSRSKRFFEHSYRMQAYYNLKEFDITKLVVLGGDGSFRAMEKFSSEFDINFVGIPSTIDNDIYGTDYCLGVDTALNVIRDALDKIRDTATSHERLFFVEVMGRDAGFLALNGAIASGAEAAIIPEFSTEVDQLEEFIKNGFRKSKNSSIVIVAESELTGGAMHYAERVKNEYPEYDVRVTILGHLQRGGSPTAHDRILASRLGAAAIDALMEDQRNVMIGIENDEIVYVPFTKAIKNDKPIKKELVNVLRELSI